MRQRPYRGKRIDNGKWAIGSLITNVIALTGEGRLNGQISIDNKTPFAAIVDHDGCVHQVDPETVGQSIGHEDANKVEIFEGDVTDVDDDYYEVAWDEKTAMFILTNIGMTLSFDNVSSDWIEVIGDIHSNPYLLESVRG